jgi:hypothetical protein
MRQKTVKRRVLNTEIGWYEEVEEKKIRTYLRMKIE